MERAPIIIGGSGNAAAPGEVGPENSADDGKEQR
jgi:hypothetical protein